MKYIARAPREGINYSRQPAWREALVLLTSFIAILVISLLILNLVVDWTVESLSPDTEARVFGTLGDGFGKLDPILNHDKETAAKRLLDRLARHWPDAPYNFKLGLIAGEEPNAAALPGGIVLVTSALLDQVETENELAFVLGHELGHFRYRHHLKRVGRQVTLVLALGLVGITGGMADPLTISSELATRTFDREQELQADAFGLDLLVAEYGHVAHAGDFFARLGRENPQIDRLSGYVSTHPGSEDRIARLIEKARQEGWRLDGEAVGF